MKLNRLFVIIIVLVSLVLCIRQLGEPDVWWQIRTGEYILDHGEVPNTDVFSYTYAGDPWFNVKWGTEVIMALVVRSVGPEYLMMLHWLVILGILALIKASYSQLKLIIKAPASTIGVGFYYGLLIFLMALAYRINARPEMMSHLFTAAYLYLFLHFYNHKTRLILLLIPLQLLWGNMHEAFGVGQVLILIFLAGLWAQRYKPGSGFAITKAQLYLASVAGVIALVSVVVHPMGIGMLTKPLDIFGQLGANKFTTELWSFRESEYWNFAAFLSLTILVFILWRFSKKGNSLKFKWQSVPIFYILIVIAFTYLAATANRNLPFFLIASAPLLCLELEQWVKVNKMTRYAFILLGFIFYLFVASGKFYERFYPVEKYGLQVDFQGTPIGAAQFIEDSQLSGNAYVDYFSSSYLLWALQPDYKSYLDLRDLDVFEAQFISNNLLNYVRPTTKTKSGKPLFRFMEDIDHFSYVVMENNDKFANFHRYMHSLPDYTLGYADPLTSVYIKDNADNAALTASFRNLSIENKFEPYTQLKPNSFARALSKTFAPWYEPADVTTNYRQYLQVYKNRFMAPL